MRRIVGLLIFILTIGFPAITFADWLDSIKSLVDTVGKLYGVNLDEKLGIDAVNNNLTSSLMGTHSYGSMSYSSSQFDWGQNTSNWSDILSIVQSGGSGGALGSLIQRYANQYPMNSSLGSSNPTEEQYYRLQAQTSLASRASSDLAFSQMTNEASNLKNLHGQIDQTKDEKSAVDLNNRLAIENADISLQQTKMLSILVQQQAIDAQEKANVAKENADFFDIK